MERYELVHRLALSRVDGIGAQKLRILLTELGSAGNVFSSSLKLLKSVSGISENNARAIRAFRDMDIAEHEVAYCEKHGIQVLCFDDPLYPARLSACVDSPPLFFFKGPADLQAARTLSVIGTRSHTDYGRRMCEEIIAGLTDYGVTVFSGLAYGIDVLAHKACVQHQLPTVGVLAHGLASVYPPAHRGIAAEMISRGGGLLSEYFSSEKPEKGNFPARNRIVAGLSDATLVIETDLRGGSMITAEIAFSYNRDIFCVPGRVGDAKSAGCNFLIKQMKAQLVNSAEDIAEALNWKQMKPKIAPQRQLFVQLTPDEELLVKALQETERLPIDEVYRRTGLNTSQVATCLLSLEMQQIVRVLPGKILCLA